MIFLKFYPSDAAKAKVPWEVKVYRGTFHQCMLVECPLNY